MPPPVNSNMAYLLSSPTGETRPNQTISQPVLMGRAPLRMTAANLRMPELSQEDILTEIINHLKEKISAFKVRNIFWPPEMMEWPCDLHTSMIGETMNQKRKLYSQFISQASLADMNRVIEEALKDDQWKSIRRAFFTCLHDEARRQERSGYMISAEFAKFYRERYNPSHLFLVESIQIPVSPGAAAPVVPVPEVHTDVDSIV